MKRINKNAIFACLTVVLMLSALANWTLLSDKRHLERKLNDYTTIQQENKLLKERVKSCEQDLTDAATMLDAATRELQSLKKN